MSDAEAWAAYKSVQDELNAARAAQGVLAEANAQLRETDAELLAALKATLKHIDDDMNNRPVVLWKLREIVTAAIARAEGRS